MSTREEPELCAWVDESNAEEAFLATLATLYDPAVLKDERMRGIESQFSIVQLDEKRAVTREAIRRGDGVGARIPILMQSQDWIIDVGITCQFPKDHGGGPGCLLSVRHEHCEMMPQWTQIATSQGDLSVPVQAAILGRFGLENMERVFLGMCAPDGHSRVRTGAYNMLEKHHEMTYQGNDGWRAPLEMAATYHGDHLVARDVAISWLYLHDGNTIASYLDLSLDALITRIEAVPAGTSIGISSCAEDVVKHSHDELIPGPIGHLRSPINRYCGARKRYDEDNNLTREQVLATLQTPSETLIQALETCAAPDAEWIEAEKLALDVLAAKKEGEPTKWVKIDQLEHRDFLEEHAPYYVRRLQNGGVMLATHPYRHLWPLWAKALDLLGIRPKTS
jgi:hypothetical protein